MGAAYLRSPPDARLKLPLPLPLLRGSAATCQRLTLTVVSPAPPPPLRLPLLLAEHSNLKSCPKLCVTERQNSEKLRSPDRELRRANHPPAESYGVPAPYPTPLATHRALQGGMARAARHRDSPIPHGDREAQRLDDAFCGNFSSDATASVYEEADVAGGAAPVPASA